MWLCVISAFISELSHGAFGCVWLVIPHFVLGVCRLQLYVNVTAAAPSGIGAGVGTGAGFGGGLLAFSSLVRDGELVLTVDMENGLSSSSCSQLR